MSDELVFYTNPMSRGRTVRWMLEEVGHPYRTEVLGYGTSMKDPAYLAINPMGKVPAIRHGKTVVTEGAAICAYLADAFPKAGLAPSTGDKRRGTYYRWLAFAAGPLEYAMVNRALSFDVSAEQRRMIGYGSYEDALNAASQAVKAAGPYLLGDRFSAVDVYFGATLGWGMMANLIEKRPEFEDYVGHLMARPASIRAREIDDGLVAQEKAESAEQ